MSRVERIVSDPSVCHGQPVIRGLRYPVATILELLASGMSNADILADYSDLEYDDLLAALEYGALAAGVQRVVPLGAGVKFLLDAQLPLRLVRLLEDAGHDVIHSSQLPEGNRTPDGALTELADADRRVMVTKDRDFEIRHLLDDAPRQLLLVTTGNVTNNNLLDLFVAHLDLIEAALGQNPYVEMSSAAVIVHGGAADR